MSGPTGARKQVIQASNAALATGFVLIIVGAIAGSLRFLLIVGIFLLAVAFGLGMVNRSMRTIREQDRRPPSST